MIRLTLKKRVLLWHLAAVGLILSLTAFGADLVFFRMVLGQFDQSLRSLAQTEGALALADSKEPPRVHDVAPGTSAPFLPRLDKFIQIVDANGHVVARSANLGNARLPTPPDLMDERHRGDQVFETLEHFTDEPVRMLSVPLEVGAARYAIQVAGSLDDANTALGTARYLFLTMAVAILCAVVLTGSILTRGLLRPIDRIVVQARVIEGSALGQRLQHPESHDEIARLVETLNEMLGRIEQVFEAQRRFTADASHELRSPLSRLRAELEVTLRRPREGLEYEEALRSCLAEVERLSQLAEELLTLARLEAGEPHEAPLKPVRLAPILDEAVARLESEARRREVKVLIDPPADLSVKVAPAAAMLVVANVLDNAVKFSPPGCWVRIQVTSEGSDAVVTVSDSGPGVPEEEIPLVFERFYRGSAARSTEMPGAGLGLAICRLVVDAQGGGISVASAPGGGATVRVRLPLAP